MGMASSLLLAFSMSTDSFAVSVSKGAAIRQPKLSEAVRIAAVFGTVEGLTPILGWATGLLASGFAKEIDHWIAFTILCFVGIKLIHESFESADETGDKEDGCKKYSIGVLVLTALATSIDAFAVGISLAFVDFSILLSAFLIGLATFTMVTIGIMTGHYIGQKIGRLAERLGGLCLIAIGTKILLEHLYIL